MFSNKNNSPVLQATIIESETVFTGNINCKEPFIIKGKFHGNISCDSKVELEINSSVKGNIEAENFIINGSLQGDIKAKKKVIILSEGEVIGDIEAEELEVASGAVFNGQCNVGSSQLEESETEIEAPVVVLNQKSA